ncbi:GNAT family N-acetyltransferase [Phytoactinopolyspora limicola]|uniref:GNAT family N-acetyltransferase n=1 Tax=Phytoactinopolyspora limicola TaxID=2715536 RepID=UPI00140E2D10|nr:GNAT family N-acetyltransferase [Phytoactinopolyspora limicola]
MSTIHVRPFRREDRDQLTALVNAHVQAVVPGASVPVNAVLSQLEREPGEFVVDPWVNQRVTLVAEQDRRVVAAAHLTRYGPGDDVGAEYRDAAEINWMLFWPETPSKHRYTNAADTLLAACLRQMDRWAARRWYADGALPAPGVYGVPEQWPHVRSSYERAGFVHNGHTEVVLLATIDDLRVPAAPLSGLVSRRAVGPLGTRITATREGRFVGYIEVDTNLDHAGRLVRFGAWADICDLHVAEPHRHDGVAGWLIGTAAQWLRLAGVARVLAYAWAEHDDELATLRAAGFGDLTSTARGWEHPSRRTSAGVHS